MIEAHRLTEAERDRTIAALKRLIVGAENSNHASELLIERIHFEVLSSTRPDAKK